MPISVSEKSIKSKIMLGEKVAVVENIKYPYFESGEHKKLCERMNDFYYSVAKKYSRYAEGKLLRRISRKAYNRSAPVKVGMKYTIALCSEKIVSVVLDLTFSDGKNFRTRRFTQMWSCKQQNILRLGEIIKTDRTSRRKIFSLVVTAAKQNKKNPAFGYFEDYLKKLGGKFDISNCFAVPRGLCFFINAGVLSPANHGADNFVLTSEELDGVLLGDFLPKDDVKEPQNANIVNNV